MAIKEILMPNLGESVTEASVVQWLVQPGDAVERYSPLMEVVSDKVTTEIPSDFDGVVKDLLIELDTDLPIGTALMTLEVEGAEETPIVIEKPVVVPVVTDITNSVSVKSAGKNAGRYSPAVLKLGQKNNIDLTQVVGTGNEGRITRKDIMTYINTPSIATRTKQASSTSKTPTQQSDSSFSSLPIQLGVGDIEIPVTPIRKAIAKNMVQSKTEIPHAWTMIEVDATNLVKIRANSKEVFKQNEGYSLSYLAFFIKAVAQALKEHPVLNSEWAGDKIIQYHDINISIAISANDLLYVPVIKQADEKSIKGIAKEIANFSNKAQRNQLTNDESKGGTFTVNSTGSYGSIMSSGIINHPQAAILQVESIVKKPVFYQESIAIRDMVNVCLSIDHRVLDGRAAGMFLQTVKRNIENMEVSSFSIY